MAEASPPAADADPQGVTSEQEKLADPETSARSKRGPASVKSSSSYRSRLSASAVQDTSMSPPLSDTHSKGSKSPQQSNKKKAMSRPSKRQKIMQHGNDEALLTDAPKADTEPDVTNGIKAEPQNISEAVARRQAADTAAAVTDPNTDPQSADGAEVQLSPNAQAASEATRSAVEGNTDGNATATAESAQLAQPELSPAEQFAQEIRSKAGWGPAIDVNVRSLMASGTLAGQPVHIQLKNREPVYLQGKLQLNGMVRCALHVGGAVNHECSLSEFEKLGASKERRPGENIHLTNYSMALKVCCSRAVRSPDDGHSKWAGGRSVLQKFSDVVAELDIAKRHTLCSWQVICFFSATSTATERFGLNTRVLLLHLQKHGCMHANIVCMLQCWQARTLDMVYML